MKLDNSAFVCCFIKTKVISTHEIYFIITGGSHLEFEGIAFGDLNFISSYSDHISRNIFQIITEIKLSNHNL